MKRVINNSDLVLTLYVDVWDNSSQVAAAQDIPELRHPSIKRKLRQSDEWLDHVNDLVRSIVGSMKGRRFQNIEAWPSKKIYTYYISFQPTDKSGAVWDKKLTLQIELRDHRSKTHDDVGAVTENLIVKTYYLNGKTYRDMMDLYREIWRILDDLQNGDFSSFLS